MSVSGSTSSATPQGRDFAARLRGDAVLVVAGELDLATRSSLGRAVGEVVGLVPDRLVVDLADVTFLDASAMGVLVGARNACRATGGDLVVRSPSEIVRRVLAVGGLTDIVESELRGDEAVANLAAPGRLSEVAAAWEAACLKPRYGAAALVFDPARMMAAIASLLDDHEVLAEPGGLAETDAAVSMPPGTSPVLAVRQLWALNEVLHHSAEVRHDDYGSGGPQRRRPGLEAPLSSVAATVITELERFSLVDPLTGLLNRRALDRDLLEALAVAQRRGEALAVIVVDVDGLKVTNDQFGHAAGDAVLCEVANCLAAAVRPGDNVYRIGGDEFVLVLPDLSTDDVEKVMQRTVVRAPSSFSWGGAGMSDDDVTASEEVRAAHLLDAADQRMLDRRTELRRLRHVGPDLEPGGPTEPGQHEAEGVVVGQVAAGYRARVVIDGAKGAIAEDFAISIDDAAAILGQVALAREQTVLTVAEGLMGRTVADARPAVPSGSSTTPYEIVAPVADATTPSVEA